MTLGIWPAAVLREMAARKAFAGFAVGIALVAVLAIVTLSNSQPRRIAMASAVGS